MTTKGKTPPAKRLIAQNRQARYNYHLEEIFEAGLVLTGSEVKSLRAGKANINDAYAEHKNNEMFLLNSYIAEYTQANRFNHHPHRPRKLLLHQKEIRKLIGKIKLKGYTLVPLSLYFNEKNIAKVEIALAKGKKEYDKRETEKKREWEREKRREMREK